MDAKGWVRHAVERLGWADEKEIRRFLDEAGEELSNKELKEALSALVEAGVPFLGLEVTPVRLEEAFLLLTEEAK
jgi:hypothetical protein